MITFVLACMLSSYHIGNSLMNDGLGNSEGDTKGLEAITESHGQQLQLGFHIDSSQALHSIWNNPNGVGSDGIDVMREPYNDYTNALTNYSWDAVLVEPYLSQGATFGSDKQSIDNFLGLTNPQAALYVYQVWPRQSWGNYGDYWEKPLVVVDSTPTRPIRQYYSTLLDDVRQQNPGRVIRQVPTGEVWFELSELIDAGAITEITMANMYRDDLHASGSLGRYVAAATIFSTLYRQPVTELPPVEFFGNNYSSELYQIINSVVWDVVSSDPYSGVGDFNNDGWVDSLDLAYWQASDLGGREFLNWQRNFMQRPQQFLTSPGPIIPGREGRLPEPSTFIIILALLGTSLLLRKFNGYVLYNTRSILTVLALLLVVPAPEASAQYVIRPYYGPRTAYQYYGGWYSGSYQGLYGNYGSHHVIYRRPVGYYYGR